MSDSVHSCHIRLVFYKLLLQKNGFILLISFRMICTILLIARIYVSQREPSEKTLQYIFVIPQFCALDMSCMGPMGRFVGGKFRGWDVSWVGRFVDGCGRTFRGRTPFSCNMTLWPLTMWSNLLT